MWQHEPGKIDFDAPLLRLSQWGWLFRENGPISNIPEGYWSVTGDHDGAKVRAYRTRRRDAWAEAVRLAFVMARERP